MCKLIISLTAAAAIAAGATTAAPAIARPTPLTLRPARPPATSSGGQIRRLPQLPHLRARPPTAPASPTSWQAFPSPGPGAMTKTGICQGPYRPHGTAIAIRPAAPAGLAARTRTGPKTIRRSAMTDYAHAVSDADAMRYQVMAQPAAAGDAGQQDHRGGTGLDRPGHHLRRRLPVLGVRRGLPRRPFRRSRGLS